MYINEGEDILCKVCKLYPREGLLYKNNLERNLSVSCPEVARRLVYTKEKFGFDMKDYVDDIKNENITFKVYRDNDELYNMLWEARNLSIDIAQLDEVPIWKRAILIHFLERRLQKLIDNKNISEYPMVLKEFTNEMVRYIDDNSINRVNNVIKIQIMLKIMASVKSGILYDSIDRLRDILDNKSTEEVEKTLEIEEAEFNEYFKERDYIYENYIVYNLYSDYLKALGNDNLHEQGVIALLDYSIFKMVLFSFWREKKCLEDEQIVDIMSEFSRKVKHNKGFLEAIYKWLKDQGFDTPGYLVTLIY